MSASTTERLVVARQGLRAREALLGVGLASASGAAILVHTFGPLSMSFTVPFVALPTAVILVGAVLVGRGRRDWLRVFSERVIAGGAAGLLATLGYDAVRLGIKWAVPFDFDPFSAQYVFGGLMTGLPNGDSVARVAGWTYHFWNGITFGVMYAIVRPRGGWTTGLAWGLTLEALMLAAYPSFLQARLDDPGFMVTSVIGHATWGLALGASMRWWAGQRPRELGIG